MVWVMAVRGYLLVGLGGRRSDIWCGYFLHITPVLECDRVSRAEVVMVAALSPHLSPAGQHCSADTHKSGPLTAFSSAFYQNSLQFVVAAGILWKLRRALRRQNFMWSCSDSGAARQPRPCTLHWTARVRVDSWPGNHKNIKQCSANKLINWWLEFYLIWPLNRNSQIIIVCSNSNWKELYGRFSRVVCCKCRPLRRSHLMRWRIRFR